MAKRARAPKDSTVPISVPPMRIPLRLVAVLSIGFLVSVIIIVTLELGAGWRLDGTERSLIVLLVLMASFAVRWVWSSLKGRAP